MPGGEKSIFYSKMEVFGAVESSCRFSEARQTRTIFLHLCWCLTDFSFSAIFSHFIDFFPTFISKTIKIVSEILQIHCIFLEILRTFQDFLRNMICRLYTNTKRIAVSLEFYCFLGFLFRCGVKKRFIS